ncbi:DUF1592 domain-containing protein [Nannocystaceae bacterium ST9]
MRRRDSARPILAPILALLACQSEPESAPTTPLRRLSNQQYVAALADLFPTLDFASLAPTLYLSSDPKVEGFVNAAAAQTPDALLIERHQQITMIVAGEVAKHRAEILPCELEAAPLACGEAWLDELAPRAWRRPLALDERERLHDYYADELALAGDPVPAIQLATQRVLLAPDFVYLIERGRPDPVPPGARRRLSAHEQATRLALLLWNTIPDRALLDAADRGELQTRESVIEHARAMLADPRARVGMLAFYSQWLEFDRLKAVQDRDLPEAWLDDPDQQFSRAWNEALVGQLRVELEAFVLHEHFEGAGTLAGLLRSRRAWLSPQLALHYGVEHPRGPWDPPRVDGPLADPEPDEWAWVELPADQRAGVLTLAGSMAMLALDQTPSPVRRGVYLLDNFLCAPPAAPPAQIDTTPPRPDEVDEPLTNRERFAAHTDDPTCSGCHLPIDALGFGFEHYDQTGFFRTIDAGLPVDAGGELEGQAFVGAIELSERLAGSPSVHRCVARKWWQYAFAGVPAADASDEFEAIADEFWASGGRFEDLLLAIVASEEFRSLPEVE